MTEHLISVGLGGDGDEIAAIEDVEAEFGIALDVADANEWSTAGDVFQSLAKALPAGEAAHPGTWRRFATALTQQTGIDANRITAESPLLCETHWSRLSVAAHLIGIAAAGFALALLFSVIG
ncbi:hypothetical protein OK349_15710 [Sphingomonas sp. BT-65]|uniref:hypothetical protein n=1 Tax=Sphingomonas sp. BT-65 TaxID=2989821 RepID=UPI0022354DD7|nr:hypothetical protein [Sphingomonas sp. BT-65]MCW4463158.1 hypothetical protein [Sphingomonas sp. BT-65]